MFLPTTIDEMQKLGWDRLDVILISGDTYIDSSFSGISVIGRVLLDAGFRVGIIAQPDIDSDDDIRRLGEPGLFWGVSSGSVDSMISNYTATGKFRNSCDLTPGVNNTRRPDRALIVYSNLIRRNFKKTAPVVLGGIEASLRRTAHYDYWSDSVRRSVLFDAKADILVYGMGERAIIEIARALKSGADTSEIRGTCYISKTKKEDYIELPSYEETSGSKNAFTRMFHLLYQNSESLKAKGLIQKHKDRYLVHNPPANYLTPKELDHVYNLPYERAVHPYYASQGEVRALDTIQFSITTHRGCIGECNFCAIHLHQGRNVISRSEGSIQREAEEIARHPGFRGIIADIGGPTANMYGIECGRGSGFSCAGKRCLFPDVCGKLKIGHKRQIDLLGRISRIKSVKKVFVASGIRHDLVMHDGKMGVKYLEALIKSHISGRMKVAPEHSNRDVLNLMGKPSIKILNDFMDLFYNTAERLKKRLYLTYYIIAAHPGCGESAMLELRQYIKKKIKINPEQVQIFTPAPSTYSALMYHTGRNPFTGGKIFIEKNNKEKEKQKKIIVED